MTGGEHVTKAVREACEMWAVAEQYTIRWYHVWVDQDDIAITAYAEDEQGGGHCFTIRKASK